MRFDVLKEGTVVRSEILLGPMIRVGKITASGLVLDGDEIDPVHAIVSMEPSGEVSVMGFTSQSDMAVNGETTVKSRIQSGDKVTFGDTTVVISFGSIV